MVVNVRNPESSQGIALPLIELEAANMPIILLGDEISKADTPVYRVIGVDRRFRGPRPMSEPAHPCLEHQRDVMSGGRVGPALPDIFFAARTACDLSRRENRNGGGLES